MTPVLGLRQRDAVKSDCTLADGSANASPGQTLATEDSRLSLAPLITAADHIDVKHLDRLIKVEPQGTEQ